MHEALFYRWRMPDALRPGCYTTTGFRLTADEANRLPLGAMPIGEPELRLVLYAIHEFSYTGAFLHGQRSPQR